MQSNGPGEPPNLWPVPEWWQAMATIVGLVSICSFVAVVLCGVFNWDLRGTPADYVISSGYGPLIYQVILLSIGSVLLLYPLSFLPNRHYRKASRVQQIRPWIIFFGIFCPFFPTAALSLFSVYVAQQMGLGPAVLFMCATLVPILNGCCVYRVEGKDPRRFGSLTYSMNAVVIVLSAVLTGLFLFVLPNSVMAACMIAGMVGALGISWTIKRLAPPRTTCEHLTVAAALAGALWLFAVPIISAKFHEGLVQSAVSAENQDSRRAAVRLLRAFGNVDDLLRGAYLRNSAFSKGYDGPSTGDYRKVYYWVTGGQFNDRSAPLDIQLTSLMNRDIDLAGTSVGGRATGVRLSVSQLDGKIDADRALAHLSWQMSFVNDSDSQQEARAQILLPAGAVVSSAVLWVNGEPRNATITAIDTARRAYENVVLGQRDPLLVTTHGADRIMIQCYPVPPRSRGGEMKIKIGITTPMELADKETARLALPIFVERNFDEIETTARFVNAETGKGENYPRTLNENSILCQRSSRAALRFAAEAQQGQMAEEVLVSFRLPAPKNLFVVVDGSANLARHKNKLIEALGCVPASLTTTLIFASDELSSLSSKKRDASSTPAVLADQLRDLQLAPFVGGPDNIPSLTEAISLAAATPLNAVVWLHGPQPLASAVPGWKAEDVKACRFYDMHIGGGSNALREYLPGAIALHSSEDTLGEDLKKCLNKVCGARGEPQFSYRYVNASGSAGAPNAGAMSNELRALCTKDKIDSYLLNDETSWACEIAIEAKLVTPVTAAIVLEAAADYENNGIEKPEELKQQVEAGSSGGYSADDMGQAAGRADPPVYGKAYPDYSSQVKGTLSFGAGAPVSAAPIPTASPMFANSEESANKAPGVAASVDGHVTDDKASNSSDQAIERSVRPDLLTRQSTTAISALPKPAMRSIARPENQEPNSPAQPFSLFGQSQSEQLSRERSLSSVGGSSSDWGGDSLQNGGRSALNILIGVMTVGAVFLIGLVSVLVHRRMYRNRYGLFSLVLAVGCGLILVKFIGTACSAAAYF